MKKENILNFKISYEYRFWIFLESLKLCVDFIF